MNKTTLKGVFAKNVWTLRSPVRVVFNHFFLIGVKDRRKICSDHHRIRFDVRTYLILFFANTSLTIKYKINLKHKKTFLQWRKPCLRKIIIWIFFSFVNPEEKKNLINRLREGRFPEILEQKIMNKRFLLIKNYNKKIL